METPKKKSKFFRSVSHRTHDDFSEFCLAPVAPKKAFPPRVVLLFFSYLNISFLNHKNKQCVFWSCPYADQQEIEMIIDWDGLVCSIDYDRREAVYIPLERVSNRRPLSFDEFWRSCGLHEVMVRDEMGNCGDGESEGMYS